MSDNETNLDTVNAPAQLIHLRLDEIIVDESFNARQVYDDDLTEKLAEDIEANGLETPLGVRENPEAPGTYILVEGFTRMRALRILEKRAGKGAPEIRVPALVKKYEGKKADIDAHFRNLKENVLRASLRPYDIGAKAIWMRDNLEVSGAAIGRELDVGKNHINNLMRLVEGLHPDILEAWKNDQPGTGINDLLSIVKYDHEKQWEKWHADVLGVDLNAEDEDEDEDEDDTEPKAKKAKKGKGKKGGRIRDRVTIQAAIEALKESDKDPEYKKGALAFAAFVLGGERIPGVYDPEKAKANAAKAAKSEKAAKKAKKTAADEARADA